MDIISLRGNIPLASGCEKIVFRHPESGRHVIKVLTQDFVRNMYKRWPIRSRLRRLSRYWVFLSELEEYIACREKNIDGLHHLGCFLGLADTNLGLGIVTEAVDRPDGSLAPTLDELIRVGQFGEIQEKALEEFLAWLAHSPIIVRDLSPYNLVWDERGYFVMIDGFGERCLLTLRPYLQPYNAFRTRKKIAKFHVRVDSRRRAAHETGRTSL